MAANPFDESGTSSYPVENPYIGQSDAFNKIQKSLSLEADSRPHTTLVYGDWGAGKTRLGHQVVAETTGESPGWHTKADDGYEQKQLISEEESNPVSNTVLPLWVHLSECETEIQTDNAARVLLNQGIENLVEGEKPIHDAIKSHLNDHGSFHELANGYRTTTAGPTERLETCLDIILNDTDIDRITVIVDEVEEASSIGKTAPDDEDTEGTPARTIQALYEGLKEAHNDEGTKYPGNMFADFLLLCTDGVDDYIPSGGVERRVDPIRLSRPTIEDATEYVRSLEHQAEIGVDISDQCIAALFFASFNNYGWFTRAMSDIVFYKQREDRPFYEILRDQRKQFSGLLSEQIIDDILADSESATGTEVVNTLYRLRPVEYTEIQNSTESIDELTAYETPLEGYSPISQLAVIDTSPENIKRSLRETGFEGTQDAEGEQSARIAGEKLDPNRLQDILRVFSTTDGNLALYTDTEDLEDLAEFAFGQGQINENAITALVDALQKMKSENELISGSYIGPNLSFLNEWNVRWKKISSIVQWINDDETWEDMLAAARDVDEEWNERVAKGLIHTRFKHYVTGAPELESHDEIDSTNFIAEIPDEDIANVVQSGKAVFINHQDKSQLRSDLKDLQRVENSYPVIYIITSERDDDQELLAEFRDDFDLLSPFLNQVSISSTGLEEEFYIQMSFLGDDQDGGFDQEMVLSNDEDYLTSHRQQPLIRDDRSWFEKRQEEGWMLERVVPDGGDPDILAEGIVDWAQERSGNWRGEETITEWKNANTESDVVPLIRVGESPPQDTFELPKFIPRVLAILDSRGPMQVAETAGQFLHDIPEDRRITSSVQNLLALLEGITVVAETDNGYEFVDSDYLRTEIVQPASLELPDDLEEFFDGFYYPPSQQTKFDFRITSDTIQDKRERLNDIDDVIKEIEHSDITEFGDENGWLDAVEDEYSIVAEVRTVRREGEDEPDIASTGNEELAQLYDDVRADKEHEQYSIAYRLNLLQEFDDILEDDCSALQDIAEERKEKVATTYSSVDHGEEHDFPTDVITTLLDDVDADLEVSIESDEIHDVLLVADSDSDGTNATIKDHIEDQDFADAFSRLEWYRSVFTQPDGFWASFIGAYEGFSDLVAQFTDFKPKWDTMEEYFENSAVYSDQIDDVEIPRVELDQQVPDVSTLVGETSDPSEINDIWVGIDDSPDETITPETEVELIKSAVSDPVDVLGGQTPAKLNDQIQTLRQKLKSIKIHHSIINAVAENDLEEKKAELNIEWAPLAHAAEHLKGDHDIEVDKKRYQDKEGFFAKKKAIDETIDDIPTEGKRLLSEAGEREQLWGKYVQAYIAGEKDKDLSNSDISEETLSTLSDLGLIEYEERFSISIE